MAFHIHRQLGLRLPVVHGSAFWYFHLVIVVGALPLATRGYAKMKSMNRKSYVWPARSRTGISPYSASAMVRLITHNLLACHAKGCNTNNFPLKLTNIELALREAEFNPDFLRGFLPKIEWDALIQASREVGDTSLPVERPEMLDDDLLRQLHHVLLEIHIDNGSMTCPNCGHVYPISNGIPNMLLAEHEIG